MKRFIDAMFGMSTVRHPMFNADGGADGSDGGDDDKGGDGDDGADKRTVTMTQAELDALIKREKGRVAKKYGDYDELRTKLSALEKADDERKKAEMSEAERLKAEKDEAARKAQEAEESAKRTQDAANKRVVDAEIRSIARALNANDANDVLSFVDKSKIAIDEDGNVTGVDEAVKAVKDAKPYLFKAPVGADASGGGNPDRNPNKSELAAKEKEYEELRAKAVNDVRLRGKLNALYHEILALKTRK